MVQLTADPAMKEADQYLETFERFEAQAKQPAWVFPLRKAGIARFAELGFPTLQQEDWRFTNVAPIAKLPFKPVFQVSRDGLTREAIAGFTFGRLAASRLVFVNGHYAPELSAPGPQPQGVVVSSLAAALADESGTGQATLGAVARRGKGTRLRRSTRPSSRTAALFMFPRAGALRRRSTCCSSRRRRRRAPLRTRAT